MGSVNIKYGIGYSEASQARYIDMEAVRTVNEIANERERLVSPIPQDMMPSMPWSPWGKNNLLPYEMTTDIETCGILNSIIDIKSRFGVCNGPVPVITELDTKTGARVIKSYVDDAEITEFIEMNDVAGQSFGWIKDQLGFGQGVCRYGLNRKQKPQITTIQRDDVTEHRLEKKDNTGLIKNIYLSAEWDKVRGAVDKKIITVPHLSPYNPVSDLRKATAANKRGYAITFRYPGWNKHYYSVPLWYAALKWVKIAQGVPEMKAAIFKNSIHIKYIVIIQEVYWQKAFPGKWENYTEDQRQEKKKLVFDDIDKWLVGSDNAYKSIFTTGYRDLDGNVSTDIDIKAVEDTMKDGKLLPDSAAANSEISFAMHFNPSIFGGNQKDGPYQGEKGGSSVREAGLMQVMLMELERQNVRRVLNVVKYFNEWDKRHPGLDFIIPATLLTTLDTGAGSKEAMTGTAKPNENGAD